MPNFTVGVSTNLYGFQGSNFGMQRGKKSPVQDKQAEIFFMPYFSSFHEDAVTIEITMMTVVEFHIVADEIHRF